jgi:hypothetical protein
VLDALASVVLLSLLALSALRALQIRGSLSVGLYRRQALWTASICVLFILILSIDFVFIFFLPYNSIVDLVVSVMQGASIFTIFGWIDTSTLIARRSDPLLRNTIHWTILRRFVWIILLASYTAAIALAIENIVAGGALSSRPSLAETSTLSVVLIVPFALGAFLLPMDALRSGDLVLRRHLRWLSLVVLAIFGVTLLYGEVLISGQGIGFLALSRTVFDEPASNVAFYVLALVFGYAILRAASSLAPINKIMSSDF